MLPPQDNFNFSSYPAPDPFALQISEWIKAASEGEIKAFEKLYYYYYLPVYRYGLYNLRQPTKAEVLADQVFLTAWHSMALVPLSQGTSFSAWLYRLAYRLLRTNHNNFFGLNSELAEPTTRPLEPVDPLAQEEEEGETVKPFYLDKAESSIQPTTEEEGKDRQDQNKLIFNLRWKILDLGFEAQLILYLRYIEQRPLAEVASLLDLSPEIVQIRVFQALKDLDASLRSEPEL